MLNNTMMNIRIDKHLLDALREDITNEDISTNAIIREKKDGKANLLCKENGILAGIQVFKRVFELLGEIHFQTKFKDGDAIKKGDIIATLAGDLRIIMSGERTALNYLQHMSGIATYTNEFVNILEGSGVKLLDTRKTTPNMRIFEKYAVKVGGGINHRFNLSDGILLKDNHIKAAGGVKKAIELVREYTPFAKNIEVEVENIPMVKEAIDAGANIIMLDNMDIESIKQAVNIIDKRAIIECSGNITKDELYEISNTGVDYVSAGVITHSAPPLDFSLNLNQQ